MSTLLVCPKNSGNTFTVCDYISKHSDIDFKVITNKEIFQLTGYENIVLCSGVYKDKAHANLTKWLGTITKNQINPNTKFYMFMTWFGRGETDKNVLGEIDGILNKLDSKIEDNYATCFGQGMGVVRIGHPDTTDFEQILNWANNL